MTERYERSPRPLPLTLLEGDSVEKILLENKNIILPKDAKVLLTLQVSDATKGMDFLNLGPTKLNEDFRGAYVGYIKDAYLGMPQDSVKIFLAPDSDERKKKRERKAYREIEKLDKKLAKDFLKDRQEDLDFFNINPDTIQQVRLHIAVDKETPTLFQLGLP